MSSHAAPFEKEVPRGTLEGFSNYFRNDILSGFLVFLIALPLCLGIAQASGYRPVAGIITAVIGAIVTTFISNSELTIKGPAAGLILVVMPTVTAFGYTGKDPTGVDFQAYRMALAVGVVAGAIQIVLGLLKAGKLGDFFPATAVHGMLAAIGVIIMIKQFPLTFGGSNAGEPLEVLRTIPERMQHLNPQIMIIGFISLLIMFGKPFIKLQWLKMIPSQLIVLLVAVPLGMYFNLQQEHAYQFMGHDYKVEKNFLVNVPANATEAIVFPEWSVLAKPMAWKWVLMFVLIGSLESVLSAKAVDMVDPWKRKTDLNSDLLAVGVGNTLAALIGGLPMISEIVRSKANTDNGARTRFADMWHGIFLLAFVALLPWALHMIPVSALAAMLVFTGFRLASPREFYNVFLIGREQLLIFVSTIVGVLYFADLLAGLLVGVAVKVFIHMMNGVPLNAFFKAYLELEDRGEKTTIIRASQSAVFTNWNQFKAQIERLAREQHRDVVVDLSGTKVVDHSFMEHLHELEEDFAQEKLKLEVIGLEGHNPASPHKFSARLKSMARLRRITTVTEAANEAAFVNRMVELGASGYTVIPCHGAGRHGPSASANGRESQVRVEVVVPDDIAQRILDFVRHDFMRQHKATVVVETVDAVRMDQF